MERRAFIGTLAGGLLAAPLCAKAQTLGRVTKVGILSTVNPRTTAFSEVMVQRLRELGYVEGQNSSSSSGTPKAMSLGFPPSPPSSCA